MEQIIAENQKDKLIKTKTAKVMLESLMKKGGIKMTNNTTKMNGTTTGMNNEGGRNMKKSLLQIMRELKAEWPDLSAAEIKEMAKEEYDNQFNEVKETKEIKPQKEDVEVDDMDMFMEFMWNEVKSGTVITSKVAGTLVAKFVKQYGKEVENAARYVTAAADYFLSEEGTKDVKRLGKDILFLIGLNFSKSLVSDFDVLVDAVEIEETVAEVKTVANAGGALLRAHKYAKEHKDRIFEEVIEYGESHNETKKLYDALDGMFDEE